MLNYFMKKMAEKQMANLPEDQRAKIIGILEKNPQLFITVAQEAQAKMKEGKDQMTALREVALAHEKELKDAIGDAPMK